MTTMRGLAHFIFIFALVVSILGSITVHASAISHCHSEQNELVADSSYGISDASHGHHARGSVHCCGSVFYIKRELILSSFFNEKTSKFIEFTQALKPFPLLEGPFQPPRA